MKRFTLGLLLGMIFGLTGFLGAQHLSRTTPSAAGPGGQGYLGDFDSNMQTLTSAPQTLTTTTPSITSMYCHNLTAAPVTVTLTDNQGVPMTYIPAVPIPANGIVQFINDWKGLPIKGMIVKASANNSINCQFAGYF